MRKKNCPSNSYIFKKSTMETCVPFPKNNENVIIEFNFALYSEIIKDKIE